MQMPAKHLDKSSTFPMLTFYLVRKTMSSIIASKTVKHGKTQRFVSTTICDDKIDVIICHVPASSEGNNNAHGGLERVGK